MENDFDFMEVMVKQAKKSLFRAVLPILIVALLVAFVIGFTLGAIIF